MLTHPGRIQLDTEELTAFLAALDAPAAPVPEMVEVLRRSAP
ncbi:DUF1778 domain-containing protein [Paracoccus sp. (in: a-proteobacteria)]